MNSHGLLEEVVFICIPWSSHDSLCCSHAQSTEVSGSLLRAST
jgi:hypothetical protein